MPQALGDWLSVNAATSFGAQLPELPRGIYHECWRPVATPVKQCRKADFMSRVNKAFKTDPILFASETVTAVFELLSDKITADEIEHVRHASSADIRALCPPPSSAASADSACRNDLAIGASTMFKDVLVNLSVADRRDPACDYGARQSNATREGRRYEI